MPSAPLSALPVRAATSSSQHPLVTWTQPTRFAGKFPDVKFEHATGYKREHPNVATYNAKFHEGRYVQGQIAAKMSKVGTAGYIASFPIPEVVMGINSFMLGAQSVNPDFKLKVVWANTWFDPGKEADAAKTLIDQGADIITQHTDSTGPMQVAAERGVMAFGQASDMFKFGEKTQLTAIVDDWAPYYIKRVKAVVDGTWEQVDVWHGMAEGDVVMAPYTNARRCESHGRGNRSQDQSGGLIRLPDLLLSRMVPNGSRLATKPISAHCLA